MGRATVSSHDGSAQYTVDLDYGQQKVQAKITGLERERDAAQAALGEQEALLFAARDELASRISALDSRILAYREAAEDDKAEALRAVEKATVSAQEQRLVVSRIEAMVAQYTLMLSGIEGRIAELQVLPLTETRQVWCADYTTDASGAVPTIEIAGEQPHILIAPSPAAHEGDPGQLTHRMAVRGPAAWYNAALLPGWQKYRPTYRSGVLAFIDRAAETATVQLDEVTSSAQSLPINQAPTLFNVPFEYMRCNSRAFNVGDEVVIRFDAQNWATPKVVGFMREPRPCGGATLRWAQATNPIISAYTFSFDKTKDSGLLEALRREFHSPPFVPYTGRVICEFRPEGWNDWILCPLTVITYYAPAEARFKTGSLYQGVPGHYPVRWMYDIQYSGVVNPLFDIFDSSGELYHRFDTPQPPNDILEDTYYYAYLRNMVYAASGHHEDSGVVMRFLSGGPSSALQEWPDREDSDGPLRLEVRVRTKADSQGRWPERTWAHFMLDRETYETFNLEAVDIVTESVSTGPVYGEAPFWNTAFPTAYPVAIDEYSFLPDGDVFYYAGTNRISAQV